LEGNECIEVTVGRARGSGQVRRPAVAGSFYPGVPQKLEASVRGYLEGVTGEGGAAPKALIAPHAGYVYSGPIAASAYALVAPAREALERVVLLGPSHFEPIAALASPSVDAFATPLGEVPLDREALARAEALPQVEVSDAAHAREHSLEVQLPFLQIVLGDFSLVPLVVRNAGDDRVAEVLELLWGGTETLVVVSSDLSHFYDYETARRLDQATTEAIEALHPEAVDHEQSCGSAAIRGLLVAARRKGLRARTLDLRSSGDTAGDRGRVVGYGAYAFA
jgi:AmmeMemoRadiSam system protein B